MEKYQLDRVRDKLIADIANKAMRVNDRRINRQGLSAQYINNAKNTLADKIVADIIMGALIDSI